MLKISAMRIYKDGFMVIIATNMLKLIFASASGLSIESNIFESRGVKSIG